MTASADEGRSLCGRWVLSQDVQAGDLVFGVDGEYRQVVRTEQRWETEIPVSNLTVRDHHSFAVGNDMLLVHNESWCAVLQRVRPGFQKPAALIAAAKRLGMKETQIHAHHIVMKTVSEYFPIMRGYVERAQAILREAHINILEGPENLTWALNWDHSVEYARSVALALENAWKKGGEAAVVKELKRIEQILNDGRKFRYP